jgi:SAM-dependent methyltransferase
MLLHSDLSHDLPPSIDRAYTPIFGWYIAETEEEVRVVANGVALQVSQADRRDLFKWHKGRICKGFYTVYAADSPDDQLDITVQIGPTEIRRATLPIRDAAKAEAKASTAARAAKRAFLLDRMICVVCQAPRRGQLHTCRKCGTVYDASTRALNAVPLGSYIIPTTINTSCFGYGQREQEIIDAARATGGWVLDFGSGLHPRSTDGVICLEIADMPSVDVVSLNSRIPFADNTFDAVLSQHVLEHVERPWETAAELLRVAKPGAPLLSTVPYVCPVHGFPYHFFNMTPGGLRTLFADADLVSHTLQADAHPINGIKQLLQVLHGSMGEPFRTQFATMTVNDIVNGDLGALLQADWAKAVLEDAWWEMPAHSTLVVKKRG